MAKELKLLQQKFNEQEKTRYQLLWLVMERGFYEKKWVPKGDTSSTKVAKRVSPHCLTTLLHETPKLPTYQCQKLAETRKCLKNFLEMPKHP
jgi:hypothetical protein